MSFDQSVVELPQKTIHYPKKMWLKSHKKLEEENSRLNRLDPLTQVNDRGSFEEFKKGLATSDNVIVFIMFDADKLKQINDKRGHDEGDIYLQKIARLIRSNIRHDDFTARYGGDEFVTIMPNISLNEYIEKYEAYIDNFYSTDEQPDALNYKQFIEKIIENHFAESLEKYNSGLAKEDRIYVSFGVAGSFPKPESKESRADDIEITQKLADKRMYIMKAKHHAQMEAVEKI